MTVHELRELLADKDEDLDITVQVPLSDTGAVESEWELMGIEERLLDLVLIGGWSK